MFSLRVQRDHIAMSQTQTVCLPLVDEVELNGKIYFGKELTAPEIQISIDGDFFIDVSKIDEFYTKLESLLKEYQV